MDHRIYNFQTACNAHSTIIKEGYILTNQVSVWEEKFDLSLTGPAFLGAKKCWWSFNLLRASCVSCAAYDSCMALGLITTTTCLAQAFPVWDDPHGRKMAPFWLSERNHYHTDNMKQHEWRYRGLTRGIMTEISHRFIANLEDKFCHAWDAKGCHTVLISFAISHFAAVSWHIDNVVEQTQFPTPTFMRGNHS